MVDWGVSPPPLRTPHADRSTGDGSRQPSTRENCRQKPPPATDAVRAPRAFPRRSAAPAAQFHPMSQCYIPMLHPTKHAQFNRQPVRLEIAISPTKQTPAPQFNRQQFATPRNTNCSHESQVTNHESRIAAALLDTNGRFRRNNNSRNSFKTNDRANSYAIQTATSAHTCHSSQITNHSHSNRQWQILEFTVTHTKQTTAPRPNRQYFAIFRSRIRSRYAPHQLPITTHQSRLFPATPGGGLGRSWRALPAWASR